MYGWGKGGALTAETKKFDTRLMMMIDDDESREGGGNQFSGFMGGGGGPGRMQHTPRTSLQEYHSLDQRVDVIGQ